MKGGYRDGLKHQKGRNKGSLHSKVAQSYMTPSLYPPFILKKWFFHLYSYMQSSRDYEDANLALESESLEMGSEIVRLRRKLEQYLLKAEEKERELLGMREQGPQAVKDQLCARLMEENKQLRAGKYSARELHTRYTVEPLITDPPRSGQTLRTDWNYSRANTLETSEKRTHFASEIRTTDTNRTPDWLSP